MLLAGFRPGGRGTFLVGQEKYPKEGRPAACVPAASPSGNLGRSICGVCRITHCALRASFIQMRQVRSRSAGTLRCQRHPANTTPQAHAKGGNPTAKHPRGPSLRSALTPSACAEEHRAHFFGYFLAARQESASPAGASPGQQLLAKLKAVQAANSQHGFPTKPKIAAFPSMRQQLPMPLRPLTQAHSRVPF